MTAWGAVTLPAWAALAHIWKDRSLYSSSPEWNILMYWDPEIRIPTGSFYFIRYNALFFISLDLNLAILDFSLALLRCFRTRRPGKPWWATSRACAPRPRHRRWALSWPGRWWWRMHGRWMEDGWLLDFSIWIWLDLTWWKMRMTMTTITRMTTMTRLIMMTMMTMMAMMTMMPVMTMMMMMVMMMMTMMLMMMMMVMIMMMMMVMMMMMMMATTMTMTTMAMMTMTMMTMMTMVTMMTRMTMITMTTTAMMDLICLFVWLMDGLIDCLIDLIWLDLDLDLVWFDSAWWWWWRWWRRRYMHEDIWHKLLLSSYKPPTSRQSRWPPKWRACIGCRDLALSSSTIWPVLCSRPLEIDRWELG